MQWAIERNLLLFIFGMSGCLTRGCLTVVTILMKLLPHDIIEQTTPRSNH